MGKLNIENMHNSDAKEKHISRETPLEATIGATVALYRIFLSMIVLRSYISISTLALNKYALKTCPVMKGNCMY